VDLALAMVENDLGSDLARRIARKLVIAQRRGSEQSQLSALLELDPKSDRVQLALAYARENLTHDLSVEALAAVARLSPRQFSRVFREETGQTPAKAIESLRVEAARAMMETSRHPVEVVARETGFGDRERMRQAFLRAFGQPPQAMQAALFSAGAGAAFS
ncbi:MAG: GlxA family transcriptional regulator, partial [Pseudomonas sp.]